MNNRIRIKLKTYNHKLLNQSINKITNTIKQTNTKITKPIPLPTKINKYYILHKPHINKKNHKQFKIQTHKQLINIIEPTQSTLNTLIKLNLSTNINIKIKL